MQRILLFLGVYLIALFMPFWLVTIAALSYALVYRAYELVMLGALLDIFFVSVAYPVVYPYTLTLATVVFIVELLKPRLSFYEATQE